jgi:hypothetical protein
MSIDSLNSCGPPCPQTEQSIHQSNPDYEIYYHTKYCEVGDAFYKLNNGIYEFIGEYSGYSTRPTYKSKGRIGLKFNDRNIFIACIASYYPDLGWVITKYLE